MRVAGTVPPELGEWAAQKIEKREFYSWSHILESALATLKQGDAPPKERKGGGGT